MAEKSERPKSPGAGGRRVAQALYLALAAAFIIGSTWEVQRQAFGAPLSSTKTGPNCSFLIGSFEEAVVRGLALAAEERTRAKADEAFEDVVTTPLAAIEKHCVSPTDREAFVAATRLREAAEATIDSQQSALAPLRAALLARKNP